MPLQEIISLVIVAVAGGYLLIKLCRTFVGRQGGPGCGQCGGEKGDWRAARKPFVPLDQLGKK